jgi:hypothetical protein
MFLRSVGIYECTRRHNSEEQLRHPHRRENLKSHVLLDTLNVQTRNLRLIMF